MPELEYIKFPPIFVLSNLSICECEWLCVSECVCVCVCACMSVCVCMCEWLCVWLCVSECVCVRAWVCVYVWVCEWVCVCERVCDSLAQCRASSGWRRGVDSGGRIRVVTGRSITIIGQGGVYRERERANLLTAQCDSQVLYGVLALPVTLCETAPQLCSMTSE